MTRNPYFWQVDTDGNQLPYINEINFGISQDVESLMLNVISGKIDIQERHISVLANKPTLSQNMEKGNYRLMTLVPSAAQQCQIYLNITHKDPAMRKMFADKSFRQALSLGLNRQEIIEIVYFGQSEAYQTGPRPTHPWYHEKLARQSTEFDADKANELRQGWIRQEERQWNSPASRWSTDLLLNRCHSNALSRSRRHAGTGEGAVGADRRRYQGQHHRTGSVLHAW